LAHTQLEQATTIHVLIGARTAADLLYTERFQALPQTNLSVHQTTEDGSAGQQGRVTDVLQPLLAAGKIDGIYACGPHGMLAALDRLGQQHKVPGQLSWEAYMRCGIGICGSCEHEGKVLCLDGPVLKTAAEIL
jgi:dihydroorotate dehydrogenase electron transfer subunit